MPPYDFNFVIQALRSLQNQQPPSGTDIANQEFSDGVQQKKQEFAQQQAQAQAQQQAMQQAAQMAQIQQQQAQQQQQSFLDPVARQYYVPNIIGAKTMYGSTNDPEVQKRASELADTWRQEAANANFDLSQYGSDVSINDAYKNLQTNDARAAVDFFQGKYAMTSKDYFDRKYYELRQQGKSVGQAQRAAAKLAQLYQADRVTYLDRMLNGYGFDGRVMSPLGQQITNQIALENPVLGQLYLTEKPGQKEAYDAEQKMAQSVLQNKSAMERLMQAYANQLDIMNAQADIDNAAKYRDEDIRRGGKVFDTDLALRDARQRADLVNSAELNKFYQQKAALEELGRGMGKSGTELSSFVAAGLGINTEKSENLQIKANAEFQKQIKDHYNKLTDNLNKSIELYQKFDDSPESTPIKQALAGDIARGQQQKTLIESILLQGFGVQGVPGVEHEAYDAKDESKNLQTLRGIYEDGMRQGLSDAELWATVKSWAGEGVSDEEIYSMIKKAYAGTGGQNK